ncbi:hypothetical protein [Vibrio alginolyticus]|uniref:hypothetical protein n=1 Tax=Vibrio alginolyticus TaxID=663 RepID=UPI00148B9A43|nr:hypothetical protein [Vibrio alginolyticus]NOI46165.1 hypothetical protein [Vibrio alginolyticus]
MTFGDLDSILLDLLSSLFIAITASYISVKLAMRKFKSEKWWDKKLHCYTEITELLSMVIIYADMVIDVELDGVEHDSAAYSSQESAFNEAIIKLQKHGHSSAILLEFRPNKAFKSDSQRLAVSLRSSIAKRCSHLNAALVRV